MRNQNKSKYRLFRILPAWALVLLLVISGAGVTYGGPPQTSSTGPNLTFGPFQCAGCPYKVFTHHFLAPPGVYAIMVIAQGAGNAKITLNGEVVFGSGSFPGHPTEMNAIVTLMTHNTLKINVWDNGPGCGIWVKFIPIMFPTPMPPVPEPEPTPPPCTPPCAPPPTCDPCCAPCEPVPVPVPVPCCEPAPVPVPVPCCEPVPVPVPVPQPDPCTTCGLPDPCSGWGCGPSTTINQANIGDGNDRDNIAMVDGNGGAWWHPGTPTVVNQANIGDGNDRDNIADVDHSGGGGGSTIINQLNMGNGDDRGNIATATNSICGPGGCTNINQVNIGDGNNRFNLADIVWTW